MAIRALETITRNGLSTEYVAAAKEFVNASKADNTRRAYKTAWAEFTAYCEARAWSALPAPVDAVLAYMTDLAGAGQKVSTLQVKLSAISFNHDSSKLPNPTKTPEIRALM